MIKKTLLVFSVIFMVTLALNAPLIHANTYETTENAQLTVKRLHESFRNNQFDMQIGKWDFAKLYKWRDIAKVDDDSVEIVIGLNHAKPNSYEELKKLVSENNVEIVNTVSIDGEPIAIVVDVPHSIASSFTQKIRDAKLSRYIEPNIRFQLMFTPNDPKWNEQWGPAKIEADYAWNTTLGDHSVLVAIIDTGIHYNHPDLEANYVPKGRDWVNDDNDPKDDVGHGTHCAGIIAATIDNGIGIAGLAQVQLMAEKGLGPEGGYATDLANAIIHAVDQGADILSNSWGGYVYSALIHDAIKYAYSQGVLVIASAGNEKVSQKLYPAACDEVIAVTATDRYDFPASFTNFGDWVELAAPGVDILSTFGPGSYISMSGTSMACPHVAGVAALYWSEFPDKSLDWLRIWLQYTADDLGAVGFDEYYGYGRVNARKAIEESPLDHDLLILSMEKPVYVELEETVVVSTDVFNFGSGAETSITVQLLVNGNVENSTTIDSLGSDESVTVNCSWTPTSAGVYNVTSYVVPVSGETRVKNNAVSKLVFVGTKTVEVPTHLSTIQEAIDAVAPGFTILVENGTYVENIHVDKPLSFIGESRDNTIIQGGGFGIVVYVMADNVTITGFTIKNSGTEWPDCGIALDTISNCLIYDNYIKNNYAGILLWECFNCSVFNNNFTNNDEYGVAIQNSTVCSVSENIVEYNDIGVWLNFTSKCLIYNNRITQNDYGIKLVESSDNRIVYNSFIDNTVAQADVNTYSNHWDNGYPSAGNYWNDLVAEDLYSGPYQNETDSDGIMDLPYTIDENNIDRYPLTKPYDDYSHDIAVLNVTLGETQIGGGQTLDITVTVENLGDIAETFNLTIYYNETAIEPETVPYVLPNKNDTITLYWSTVGVTPSFYIIKVEASQVPRETALENNIYVDGTVEILPAHDVTVTSITALKTVVGEGYDNVTINVVVLNKGTFTETFTVALYADEDLGVVGDEIFIGNYTVSSLENATATTIIFTWNTTSLTKGVYTLNAYAYPVPDETYTVDNTFIDGVVLITIPGDTNGDRTVNMKDLYSCLILHFGCEETHPCYVSNYDINSDGKIDMKDIFTAILHFGESW